MHQFFLSHLSQCVCVHANKLHLFTAVMYALNVKTNLFVVKELLFLKIIHH